MQSSFTTATLLSGPVWKPCKLRNRCQRRNTNSNAVFFVKHEAQRASFQLNSRLELEGKTWTAFSSDKRSHIAVSSLHSHTPSFSQSEGNINRRELIKNACLVSTPFFLHQLQFTEVGNAVAEVVESENFVEKVGAAGKVLSFSESKNVTKAGSSVPKAYAKSVEEVINTLRESLAEDAQQDLKYRRAADSAKEAIRNYMASWRGAASVVKEDSYVAVENVLRELSKFYSKNGPRAALPHDVKDKILSLLEKAEQSL